MAEDVETRRSRLAQWSEMIWDRFGPAAGLVLAVSLGLNLLSFGNLATDLRAVVEDHRTPFSRWRWFRQEPPNPELSIRGETSGLRVVLDGRPQAKRTQATFIVTPGEHRFSVVHPDSSTVLCSGRDSLAPGEALCYLCAHRRFSRC